MSSVRIDVRQDLKTHLSSGTSAEDRVFVNRKVPIQEDQQYPVLLIYSALEDASRLTQIKNVYQRTYSVVIEIRVSEYDESADGPVDDFLDNIASEVEERMKTFVSSSQAVKGFVYTGAEPALDDEGDTLMGSLKMKFDFNYLL